MEDELRERFGDDPSQLVHSGLAKLLEDRCEFEVEAGRPPEEIRAAVFRLAAASVSPVPRTCRAPVCQSTGTTCPIRACS